MAEARGGIGGVCAAWGGVERPPERAREMWRSRARGLGEREREEWCEVGDETRRDGGGEGKGDLAFFRFPFFFLLSPFFFTEKSVGLVWLVCLRVRLPAARRAVGGRELDGAVAVRLYCYRSRSIAFVAAADLRVDAPRAVVWMGWGPRGRERVRRPARGISAEVGDRERRVQVRRTTATLLLEEYVLLLRWCCGLLVSGLLDPPRRKFFRLFLPRRGRFWGHFWFWFWFGVNFVLFNSPVALNNILYRSHIL